MWCKGAVAVSIICALIFTGVIVQAEPVAHKNFSEAEEDLFSLLAFFSDLMFLSEQSLVSSYESNGTLEIEDNFSFQYDTTHLQNSTFLLQELQQRIIQSNNAVSLISDTVKSYEYLKELATSIDTFVVPIEDLVSNHEQILITFDMLITLVNNGTASEYDMYANMSKIDTAIQSTRKNIQIISDNILEISEFYTVDTIKETVSLFTFLLDRYEYYLNQFIGKISITEPKLLLFSSTDDIYLGEAYTVHGYFITDQGFISDQSISLLLDSTYLSSSLTDSFGSYMYTIQTNLLDEPICHKIQAHTEYKGTSYLSNEYNITYHKIPTTLHLSTSKQQYDPNEPVVLMGQLQTKFNQGIIDEIRLNYAGKNSIVLTNSTGHFTFEISEELELGRYTTQAFFEPDAIYESCASDPINFSVNLPTLLSISAYSETVDLGDDIRISGQLKERISSKALPLKTIFCVVNGRQLNTTVLTNENGWYSFSISTDTMTTQEVTLYCLYNSDNASLRSCQSQCVTLTIQTGFIASFSDGILGSFFTYFPPILIIICILLVLGGFYLFYYLTNKKQKKNGDFFNTNFTYNAMNSLHKPTNKIRSFFFRSQSSPQASIEKNISLRQKIIFQYRLLLRYLSNHGMRFSASHTSRDIEHRLRQTGSEQQAVESVTQLFEEARYSNHQPEKEDMDSFDKNVFSIITDFQRDSK